MDKQSDEQRKRGGREAKRQRSSGREVCLDETSWDWLSNSLAWQCLSVSLWPRKILNCGFSVFCLVYLPASASASAPASFYAILACKMLKCNKCFPRRGRISANSFSSCLFFLCCGCTKEQQQKTRIQSVRISGALPCVSGWAAKRWGENWNK